MLQPQKPTDFLRTLDLLHDVTMSILLIVHTRSCKMCYRLGAVHWHVGLDSTVVDAFLCLCCMTFPCFVQMLPLYLLHACKHKICIKYQDFTEPVINRNVVDRE